MVNFTQKLSAAAEATGLSYDQGRNILYGTFNGYSFAVPQAPSNARYCLIHFYVTHDGSPLSASEGKQIAKESNKLVEFFQPAAAPSVSFMVKLEKDEAAAAQKILDALTYLSETFASRGYVNTCEGCHQPLETEPCAVGNGLKFFCPDCFESVSANISDKAQAEADTPENVVAGIVGALGGALLGALVVVIMGQLGYVSALSGLVAAICALKGYELLAKKMSVKGAIIACVAMAVMLYVGHRANVAIEVLKAFREIGETDLDFFTVFRAIPALVKSDSELMGEYLKELFMVYLFALLGAVPTVIKSIKGQKTKYTVQKLN